LRKFGKDLYKLDNNNDNNFSLEKLSDNLKLSIERSRHIYNLYEKTVILKDKSDILSKELDKEKSITQTQSEFISLVSHEFKTPLAIIKTSMDVLKRIEKKEDNILGEQIKKIEKAIIRINKMMDSTLNLSKLESGKLDFNPECFNISDLLEEIIKRHKDINPDAIIKFSKENKAVDLYADINLIDLIYNNLISNSIKYSKSPASIDIKHKISANYHEITISDKGIGINEEDLKKICTKFFRANNAIGISGTGIGLYLVKKLVELHNGEFKIESKENHGTTFYTKYPLIKLWGYND